MGLGQGRDTVFEVFMTSEGDDATVRGLRNEHHASTWRDDAAVMAQTKRTFARVHAQIALLHPDGGLHRYFMPARARKDPL